jgi:hypothetical protein
MASPSLGPPWEPGPKSNSAAKIRTNREAQARWDPPWDWRLGEHEPCSVPPEQAVTRLGVDWQTATLTHTPVLGAPLVAFGHHCLHSHCAFDRIDHRGKLKQHAVPHGLHEAAAVFRHDGVGNLAVFAERASGADLVEAHEPRVARHVSRDYGR